MSAYQLLVFVHVLGAIGIFVALGIESFSLGRLRTTATLAEVPALFELRELPSRLGPIAMLGSIAAGISLMAHGWGRQPWILAGIVALVGMIAVGAVTAARAPRHRSPAALTASLRLRAALAIGIVGLMTVKPVAAGAWLILIASALFGAVASIPLAPRRSRVVLSALAVLLLTDVHHAYGAHVYQTPWRYHVVVFSIPAMAAILWSARRLQRRPGGASGRSVLVLTTLIVPIAAIGGFEGFYNHLLKDVLWFAGASPAVMTRLFPPPAYEMPNDAFFEITGVLQAFLGATTAWHLYRLRARTGGAGPTRIAPGASLGDRNVEAISGETVRIPDPKRLVHLQFRRFAGCPVCNLHLQSFVRRYSEIERAGIRPVVLFHSSAQELRPHAGNLPFAVIADPEKRLYTEFAVESGPRALLDPRAWGAIWLGLSRSLLAILRRREAVPSMRPRGGRLGLPADFLISRDGRVLASKYGEHADDQWSVDELLHISESATGSVIPPRRGGRPRPG